MKHIIALIATLIAVASTAAPLKIQQINIDDEIGAKTWRIVSSGLNAASANGADLVVVKLNTYGGEVSAADSIRTALLRFKKPVVAFVDNNAASAGALIALACDSVFMTPGASMGAATVVSGTDGTAMPDKYQSYMRGMMRATAESHGKVARADSTGRKWRRDPLIAEAMVDTRIVVPGLIDSTKVLTFTTNEAIEWGYAEASATSLDDALSQLNITDYTIEEFKPSWSDHLIGFLANKVVQGILISLILLGLYWEIQMPASGLPITAAIICAILYFLPSFLDGDSISAWAVVLFAAGLILLALEIFVVPGFGVTGISGIVCVAASLVWVLAENIHFDSLESGAEETAATMGGAVAQALAWFGGALALAAGATAWLTSRHGPAFARRHTELTHEQRVEDGYIGVDMRAAAHVGSQGAASTPLRPSGKITIEQSDGTMGKERYDAVAIGGFIDAGERIEIVKYENAQLYVRRSHS